MMNAPALLLIHGYPFDHTLWELITAHLDPRLQVLAPDLRGFDGRPPGPDEPSLEPMAEDLKQMLEARQIEQAVVAGMSMGGYVALAFAERYPQRLSGLALISSQAAGDTDEARANRRAMVDKVRRDGPEIAAQAAISKMFGRRNPLRPDLARYAETGAQRAGAAGLAWALEAMARRPDRTHVVRSLRVPLLVMHGTEDQFIPAERARALAASAQDGRYVEIRGVGHATPLEAPQDVAEALNELVRRIGTL